MIIVFILLIGFAGIYCYRNWPANNRKIDLGVIILLALALMILYYDYIWGDKVFLFYDVAIDSFGQTYPELLSRANRITKGIWREYINFNKGLGNRENTLTLGSGDWFCILGKEAVARWMGINHYLKQLVAGIAAYYWAKIYTGDSKTSAIICFAYIANAGFIVRGAWYSYPNTALALMLWLLAYEIQHKYGKGYILPLATIFFFYNESMYNCLLWGGLFAFYILFRMLVDRQGAFQWKRWIQIEIIYGIFALIGMADVIIAQFDQIMHSNRFARVKTGFSFWGTNLFTDSTTLASGFLRTVGQSINGISEDFTGKISFLDDPSFYCGILLFLIIPLSIYNLEKNKSLYYIAALVCAGFYVIFNPLRQIANGFSSVTFKMSSNWISIFILIIAMEGLTKIFRDEKLRKGSGLIFGATVIVSLMCLIIAFRIGYVTRMNDFKVSVVFILLYAAMALVMYMLSNLRGVTSRVLCLIMTMEIVVVSWSAVNQRVTVKKNELAEKKYYNDYVVDAVQAINMEDNGWYRLERREYSVGPCDSLAQEYYGTVSYIGGTEADQGNIVIYQTLEFPRQFEDFHALLGTGGNVYGGALLGVKYYLSNTGSVARYGMKYLTQINNLTVYENTLALPLAYTYDYTMSETDFEKLSIFDRGRNMLKTCVVNDELDGIEKMESSEFDFSELLNDSLAVERSGNIYKLKLDGVQTVIIRMQMSGKAYNQRIYFKDAEERQSSEIISYENGEKIIEVCCNNLSEVSFSDSVYNDISSIEFYAVEAEKYYKELEVSVEKLQNNAMEIIAHDNIYNHIEGTVDCESPRVLATSIPFSENWKIQVDGQEADVMVVNKGFIGCYLDEGVHDITIYYDGKNWLEGNLFRLIGYMMAVLLLISGVYNERQANKAL